MPGRPAGIEVRVREIEPAISRIARGGPKPRHRVPETGDEERLRFRVWRLEREGFQRTDFRQQPVQKSEKPCEPPGPLVIAAVITFEPGTSIGEDEPVS